MKHLVSAGLLVAAAIHLLPLSGVLGGERLALLYGIPVEGADLQILLRHRAVLFGLLGGLLLVAAFRRSLQVLALVAGLVSALSFLVLAWSVGGYNAEIARVFRADVIAVIALAVSAAACAHGRRRG